MLENEKKIGKRECWRIKNSALFDIAKNSEGLVEMLILFCLQWSVDQQKNVYKWSIANRWHWWDSDDDKELPEAAQSESHFEMSSSVYTLIYCMHVSPSSITEIINNRYHMSPNINSVVVSRIYWMFKTKGSMFNASEMLRNVRQNRSINRVRSQNTMNNVLQTVRGNPRVSLRAILSSSTHFNNFNTIS